MSDTPRTDAETMRDEYDHVDTEFGPFAPPVTVGVDFARQLERELAEVTKQRDELMKSIRSFQTNSDAFSELLRFSHARITEVTKERDHLKKLINNFCTNQKWAAQSWKVQKHIKPLFDVFMGGKNNE